jgi:hypothetical protein
MNLSDHTPFVSSQINTVMNVKIKEGQNRPIIADYQDYINNLSWIERFLSDRGSNAVVQSMHGYFIISPHNEKNIGGLSKHSTYNAPEYDEEKKQVISMLKSICEDTISIANCVRAANLDNRYEWLNHALEYTELTLYPMGHYRDMDDAEKMFSLLLQCRPGAVIGNVDQQTFFAHLVSEEQQSYEYNAIIYDELIASLKYLISHESATVKKYSLCYISEIGIFGTGQRVESVIDIKLQDSLFYEVESSGELLVTSFNIPVYLRQHAGLYGEIIYRSHEYHFIINVSNFN